MNSLEQTNDRIEKRLEAVQGDLKKVRQYIERKDETLLDCEYLEEKYSIKCPINSTAEVNAFEKKLQDDRKFRSDTVSLDWYKKVMLISVFFYLPYFQIISEIYHEKCHSKHKYYFKRCNTHCTRIFNTYLG